MEGGSTFTIGKGFGQMLQRIAWEKLTEKYNPREAVEIITKSLLGCTEGMAVDILDGKIILREDELTQEVLGESGPGGRLWAWISEQRIHLEEEAKEWVEVLERLRQTIADAGGRFEFTVRYPELVSYISGDTDAGILDNPHSGTVEQIKGAIEGSNDFFAKVEEVYGVIAWMCDALNKSRVLFSDSVLRVRTIIDSLMCSDPEVEASIRKQDFQKQRLSEWMENEKKNRRVSSNRVEARGNHRGVRCRMAVSRWRFLRPQRERREHAPPQYRRTVVGLEKDSGKRDAESGSLAGRERLG
jgi:hypothetical protein|nr:MAG TPA: hypothetical protein [Caudoviricetes sp.]